jgi:hypothetical protein
VTRYGAACSCTAPPWTAPGRREKGTNIDESRQRLKKRAPRDERIPSKSSEVRSAGTLSMSQKIESMANSEKLRIHKLLGTLQASNFGAIYTQENKRIWNAVDNWIHLFTIIR